MKLLDILILYLVFRAKQLVCDFFLQNAWMAYGKGKPFAEEGWKPLFAHAGIHGMGTLIVMLVFAPGFWWLGLLDVVIHGLIDKSKEVFLHYKKWSQADKQFWWVFGIDQELHNLTHLMYVVFVVIQTGSHL